MFFNTYTTIEKHEADQNIFKPESKTALGIFRFSSFHLCKLHMQVLSGKISLSATDGKHMCKKYTGETVQEHVILGEILFMRSCQRYQDFS